MVAFNKAQTGNRVYRGTGGAPNRGQVSGKGAQGYIKRELRNKATSGVRTPVGRDGKSDNRSTVAAQALKRQGKAKFGPGQAAGKPNIPTGGGPATPGAPVGAPPAPATPQITVTDNGILELPYDQNSAVEDFEAVNAANDEIAALQLEEQQADLSFMQGKRDADVSYGQVKKQNVSGNASSGTLHSSQYGKDVADSASAYSSLLSDLTMQNAQFKQSAALRKTAIQNSLSQQLRQNAQSRAASMAEDAGSFGFDTTAVPVNTGGPNGESGARVPKGRRGQSKPKPKQQGKPRASGFNQGKAKPRGKK